jgi:hypothetical protein
LSANLGEVQTPWQAITVIWVHIFSQYPTVKIYNFALLPALITTLAMLVMLVATIAWGWISFSALPGVLARNYGSWGTGTQVWFIGIITLMTISTLAAFFGLVRGRSAQKKA